MTLHYHTAESVTEGHPDVVCNKIAGEILDAAIRVSESSGTQPRLGLEVSVKGDMNTSRGTLMLFGEVTLPAGTRLDYEKIARDTIEDIGYTNPDCGFWHGLKNLHIAITEQSADIASGVGRKRTGAGDQGLMFGGAVAGEGAEHMPLPIMIAHALTTKYTELYKKKRLKYLKPDGKSQVVIGYNEHEVPVTIDHVTIAASHDPKVKISTVRRDLKRLLIEPVIKKFGLGKAKKSIVNGAGAWTTYGPLADAGTTNRKIIADSYGGAFPHGGGGFNGKDWTKVDVAGSVGTRYVAKRLVDEGLAQKVQIEVGYTIGQPEPTIVNIHTFDTNNVNRKQIRARALEILDFSVDAIIDRLQLAQPVYAQAAVGGWFGRREFPWEQIG